MKRILLLLCITIGCVTQLMAQHTIKGTVFDADSHETLIGSSVYADIQELKTIDINSTIGVITNMDGQFTIEIPEGLKKLYVSYMGYETQSFDLVAGRKDYTINLRASSLLLDGVVVTGYQTIERRKLTAAISKIDITDEKIGAITSIDQALEGQIAGLSSISTSGAPGAPAKIRIRGTASMNGTQDPLWVLDGIPLEGTEIPAMESLYNIDDIGQTSIAGLNPSDIASITVLKDAAATAIYGARAANGVIVITTKNGKSGKTRVSFSSKLTYQPKTSINRLNLMNGDQKVQTELNTLRLNIPNGYGGYIGYNDDGPQGAIYNIINTAGLLKDYRKDGMTALTDDVKSQISTLRGINTDWNDILFHDVFNQQYNLSISGGNDRADYYTSVGYTYNQASIKKSDNTRFNAVTKVNYKVNKFLKVGASLFANRRKSNSYLSTSGYTNPLYYSRVANPYNTVYDKDGNYNYDKYISLSSTDFNIVEEMANTSNENVINSLTSIFDAELRLDDRFKLTSQLGFQYDGSRREKFADKETFAMRRLFDRTEIKGKSFLPDGGYLTTTNSNTRQVTWKGMADYRDTFLGQHEVEIMIGSELRRNWYESDYNRAFGYDPSTMTSRPVVFPDQSRAESYPLSKKTSIENAYVSAFSTASYTYAHKYTLGASIRFDGSDVFGVDKKYRYLPLYSVSGLWRLSNESFMESQTWIDNLVFRASYGLQGNIDKNTSPYLLGKYDRYSILPDGTEDVINISSAPNNKLRWEKTSTYNFGFDLSILENAVNLTVDYYYRKGTDLIGSRALPLSSGFSMQSINWASMENEGIEVALTTRNIHTKDFMWTTNFNFAYNRNKVLRETVDNTSYIPSREGHPVGALYGIKTAGIDENGQILFYNDKKEKVTAKEKFGISYDPAMEQWGYYLAKFPENKEMQKYYDYIGSSDAPYTGGLSNTFTYKNWELGVNMTFNLGGYVRVRPDYSLSDYNPATNSNKAILDAWSQYNKTGTSPALPVGGMMDANAAIWGGTQGNQIYNYLDTWVKKMNYARLHSVRLTYRLPENVTNYLKIGNASLTLEGRDLAVFSSNYDNYLDPETMGNPYAIPVPKQYILTLNVNF